jgi:hypothetical protein
MIRRNNRRHFVRSRAGRCHLGGNRFAASVPFAIGDGRLCARPLARIFRRRVSQANTGGEALRRVRHRIDGPLRFDREAERARRRGSRPIRSSKPDADALRADHRAFSFQRNKRPVREPVWNSPQAERSPPCGNPLARIGSLGFVGRSLVTFLEFTGLTGHRQRHSIRPPLCMRLFGASEIENSSRVRCQQNSVRLDEDGIGLDARALAR